MHRETVPPCCRPTITSSRWSCYRSAALQVSGFVHAPTEELAGATWRLLGQDEGPTVKGLIWNAGFYLWRQGSSPTLAAGLAKAEGL